MQVQLFSPHIGQQKIIDGFADSDHKFCVVATGRQFGKSLLAQNLMMYWLLENNNTKGAYIAPVYGQCRKVFDELTSATHQLITKQNRAELTITFVNGSTLQFLSTDNYNSIRGYSFHYMVVDEAAFIKEQAIQEAVLPTLTALGKKCLVISTPKSKNWFYEWFMRSSVDNTLYCAYKGISHDNPHVDQDFILDQQKSLPPEIYRQEYLAEFSESGNDVFTNVDNVCILNNWNDNTRGGRFYCGIDLGLQHDYSVLCIMDDGGTIAYMERINGSSYADITRTFVNAIKKYNVAGGFCEVNGPGLPVFEVINSQVRRVRAFTTTSDSKTTGIRKLIYDIQEGLLTLPSKELFPALYSELSTYSYKINANGTVSFNAPSGMYDDCVMALMLANEARNQVFKQNKLYVGGLNKQTNYERI